MKTFMRNFLIGALLCLGLSACDGITSDAPSAVSTQRTAAQQIVKTEQTYSYEINNITKRRVMFGKPGVIGYVVFMNQAGQPVQYLAVDGKCTSSGKRITPMEEVRSLPLIHDNGRTELSDLHVTPAVGEDGAYGSSDSYVYCFTSSGRYVQWSGEYLYSDKPFDLTIKPLVVDLSGKQQGQ